MLVIEVEFILFVVFHEIPIANDWEYVQLFHSIVC